MTQNMMPKWMVERKDFKELQSDEYFDIKLKIVSICRLDQFKRDDAQKQLVAHYLQKLSLFKLMPPELLIQIGASLQAKKCPAGTVLCRQGDIGDCMYIIFKGAIDVIISDKVMKTFAENEHVGRNALENDVPSSATLICPKESYILILLRYDFQNCLNNIFKLERPKWVNFMNEINFLKNFHPEKIAKISASLKGRFMSTKDCLYKVGDPIDNVYFVKNGTLIKSVVVDIEQSNRWPTKAKEWKLRTVTTRLQVPLKYTTDSILGYYEIVTWDTLALKSRTETIDALEDSFVLYVNKAKFNEVFDPEDQKYFKEYHDKMHPASFEKLIEKVKSEEALCKSKYETIRAAIGEQISCASPSQVELTQKRYSRVLESAERKLNLFKRSKNILQVQERSKYIASYYE